MRGVVSNIAALFRCLNSPFAEGVVSVAQLLAAHSGASNSLYCKIDEYIVYNANYHLI